MPKYDFDLFTIGAGSGGVAASRRAGGYGAKVAICEELRVGGTCVLRGCVPKKLLVYGSHFREELEDAPGFGWNVGACSLDWGRLIDSKNRELDRLNEIYIKMLGNAGVEIIDGRGVVVDPHTVEVAGRRYTAQRILVAVGGWPTLPEGVPGIEHAITSNEALELRTLPRRVGVVGGGYIAVEFAGILTGDGADVHVIARADKLLRGFDDDIRTSLAEEMTKKGVHVHTSTHVTRIEKQGEACVLHLDRGEPLAVDCVLYATGRHPNTRGLGLESLGIELDAAGAIVVDDWSRTAVDSIFAVGDATNRPNLTPIAIQDGRAFTETHYNDNPTAVDHRDIPTAVFSQPPVGTVGMTEAEARAAGHTLDVYRARFRPMRNILAHRDEHTMVKLIVDRETDRVLGCHMVGTDAPEIIQGMAVAIKCGATKRQFDATVGIHPTAAEEFVTMQTPVGS